ncbi:hypothetical protein GDO81_009318 [Engystomops pustulosus]|uniref:Uncharacterized protein n=1 Tax=Engystomops pustulosus TaxID=76066 RepID=A0AAV7BPW9_ENGPU|nr:hypothetical protein GDO81_009318 [Engystomops pustulosus]
MCRLVVQDGIGGLQFFFFDVHPQALKILQMSNPDTRLTDRECKEPEVSCDLSRLFTFTSLGFVKLRLIDDEFPECWLQRSWTLRAELIQRSIFHS